MIHLRIMFNAYWTSLNLKLEMKQNNLLSRANWGVGISVLVSHTQAHRPSKKKLDSGTDRQTDWAGRQTGKTDIQRQIDRQRDI